MGKVIGWMRVNKLNLICDKSGLLLVNDKAAQGLSNQPVLQGVALVLKKQVCTFGVLLDPGLVGGSGLLHGMYYVFSTSGDTPATNVP